MLSTVCIILPTCPNPYRVQPKELFPRLMCHVLLPPASTNIGVGGCLVASWGQRSFMKGFGHLNKNKLGRTCGLDEAWVEVDLVGSEILRWLSILNHRLAAQLRCCSEIWVNLALGGYFTPRFVEDIAYRCAVFVLRNRTPTDYQGIIYLAGRSTTSLVDPWAT